MAHIDLQHQEMAITLGMRQRFAHGLREARGRIAIDGRDPGHLQAGREEPAHAAGDEYVAHAHVGVGRQVAHFDLARRVGAESDKPQAVAQHLDRNGDAVVGEQGRLGSHGRDAHQLPHHAAFVDHGHAGRKTGLAAFVEHQALLAAAVGRLVQHFDHHGRFGRVLGDAEQPAQLGVFGCHLLGMGGYLGQLDALALQGFVFLADKIGGVDPLVDLLDQVSRRQDDALERIERDGHHTAHGLEHTHARIDQHQGQRQHDQHHQPDFRGRAASK